MESQGTQRIKCKGCIFRRARACNRRARSRLRGGSDLRGVVHKGRKAVAKGRKAERELWLVWAYEGKQSLYDCMKDAKEFPYNLEESLLGAAPLNPKP
jgi:hypothetical protein